VSEPCTFCETWDPVTLDPTGPQCGKPAVEALHWKDGRVSVACSKHGIDALDADARELLRTVRPLRESES
jgi:hypothetical protein